ncbi:MAG TPA: M3 family metallopeptidase [Jatrophihabitans sp.]
MDALPLPTENWPDWLRERVDTALAEAREHITAVKDGTPRDTLAVLDLWNEADIALGNADAIASVLAQVHPDEHVRKLAEDSAQEVSRIRTERGLDRDLYDVLVACDRVADTVADRLRERTLRDFRRSGVDRDDDVRARLRAIAERLVELEQQFSRVIRDDVRSVALRPDQLDGLPADFIAAHPAGDDGLVTITTDYPDLIPFRTFAHDAAARHGLMVAFLSRGWPDNDAVLVEMLDLRAEQAQLLGYADWPDYDAEVKMVGSGEAILEFVDRITAATDAPARRDLDTLRARQRRDDPDAAALTRADTSYYEELVRRENYDVDSQQVRQYFDFGRVRAGLLEVTAKLFGIEYWPRPDVAAWHEDVVAYDVMRDGTVIGRIYLDLHPRESKFKHAAQFTIADGISERQLPEGALVCNMPRELMEHTHVTTLFHEFGHLVHHVLGGDQRWARFAGVATEWDFVEAPSQLLEEWAWDVNVLKSFAHDGHGRPIPDELVERMRAAREFGTGNFVRTQTSFAAISYLLHRDRPRDLTAAVRDIQERYDLVEYLPGTHFHTTFGHLAGYTSAYYTYMWSLVIAKDLFSAFDRANLLDPQISHRYRDAVLAPGGSRDAADLVADFLGRPYSFDAFEGWLGA